MMWRPPEGEVIRMFCTTEAADDVDGMAVGKADLSAGGELATGDVEGTPERDRNDV